MAMQLNSALVKFYILFFIFFFTVSGVIMMVQCLYQRILTHAHLYHFSKHDVSLDDGGYSENIKNIRTKQEGK